MDNNPVEMKVYYRGTKKNLRQYSIYERPTKEGVKDAINVIMEELHKNMEHYFKPVLVLLQGGKV